MERQLGRHGGRLALGVTVALVVASTAATGVVAQDKPYEGVTLNVSTYSSVPEFDFYATLIPEFEEATGIKVNYVQQPVAAQDQKIPLQLQPRTPRSTSSSRARRTSAPTSAISGVAPLDEFINNPDLTPAEWDFSDIAPAVEVGLPAGRRHLLHRLAHGRRRPLLQHPDVRGGRHHGAAAEPRRSSSTTPRS